MWEKSSKIGDQNCHKFAGSVNPSELVSESGGRLVTDIDKRTVKCDSPQFSETSKYLHSSETDSGFISGSNLQSDDKMESTLSTPFHQGKWTDSAVDSGIDISEQLGSLQLSSHKAQQDTSLSFKSQNARLNDSFLLYKPSSSATVRPVVKELSEQQIILLQEIFQGDEAGDTSLHVAVMRGFVEVVYQMTRLLPHQAFLDYPNHNGKTSLHLAAAIGSVSLARHLLVCGASTVARDHSGNTPLHIACLRGDNELAIELMRPVTAVEVCSAGLSYSPAHVAGPLAADLVNYEGQSCIHLAAMCGHRDVLRTLTFYDADINAKDGRSGRTALHYAVDKGDLGLVATLNDLGAKLDVETYAGLSAYQVAVSNGVFRTARLLQEMGAMPKDPPVDSEDDDDESLNEDAPWSDLRIAGALVSAPPLSLAGGGGGGGVINADQYL